MNREKLREAIKAYPTNNRYVQPRGFDITVKEGWTEYLKRVHICNGEEDV